MRPANVSIVHHVGEGRLGNNAGSCSQMLRWSTSKDWMDAPVDECMDTGAPVANPMVANIATNVSIRLKVLQFG